MRQLKFRDYDMDNKKLRYFDMDSYDRQEHDAWGNIMQFSGFHDKNGNELYEGDICKVAITTGQISESISGEMLGIVKYDNGFYINPIKYIGDINRRFGENTIFGFLRHSIKDTQNMHIIGNIHENPDLI